MSVDLRHWDLISLGAIVAVALLCFTFAVVKIYPAQGQQMRQTVEELTRDQLVLRLFAVGTIVIVSAVLTLAEALGEGMVALLSSVAKFVLGGHLEENPMTQKTIANNTLNSDSQRRSAVACGTAQALCVEKKERPLCWHF